MIDSISRPKPPSGRSYALKTSQLQDALAEAGVGWHVDLVYWTPIGGESILEGHYWPPNVNIAYPRVYVRTGSVPSEFRKAAEGAIKASALPQFIKWLRHLMALPEGSPPLAANSYFNAIFTADGLSITNQPIYKSKTRKG